MPPPPAGQSPSRMSPGGSDAASTPGSPGAGPPPEQAPGSMKGKPLAAQIAHIFRASPDPTPTEQGRGLGLEEGKKKKKKKKKKGAKIVVNTSLCKYDIVRECGEEMVDRRPSPGPRLLSLRAPRW